MSKKALFSKMNFREQSHFFAQLSNQSYLSPSQVNFSKEPFGYQVSFFSKEGSQAYLLYDQDEIIIVCRGTQPSEFHDIAADLKFRLVPNKFGKGKIHRGFQESVDKLWDELICIVRKVYCKQELWICGHSLGAAMALILAFRFQIEDSLPNPVALYTYGCPRTGNQIFVRELKTKHFRWVNNADIVTRVPIWPYWHDGQLCYMNHWGNVRNMTFFQRIKDRIRGFIRGLRNGEINYFINHSIQRYENNLDTFRKGVEWKQSTL